MCFITFLSSSKACVFQILAMCAAPSSYLKPQFFPLLTTPLFFLLPQRNRFLSFTFNFEIVSFIECLRNARHGAGCHAYKTTAGVWPECRRSDPFRDVCGAGPRSPEPRACIARHCQPDLHPMSAELRSGQRPNQEAVLGCASDCVLWSTPLLPTNGRGSSSFTDSLSH